MNVRYCAEVTRSPLLKVVSPVPVVRPFSYARPT